MTPSVAQAWKLDDYGTPDQLTLSDQALPPLAADALLVQVEAAGLNPLDLKLIGGAMREFMPVVFPFTPGSDICGRVVAIGAEVTDYAVGDRVVGMTAANGGMARQAVLAPPAIARVSDDASPTDLAVLPEAGMTAMSIMREGGIGAGMRVAIIGATGGIGLLLVQLAAGAGADVIGTARPEDEASVLAAGATTTADYSQRNAIEAVLGTAPEGVDVLVDLIAQSDALLESTKAVRRGGTLVSTLVGPDPQEFGPEVTVKYIRLRPSAEDLARLVEEVAAGRLRPHVSRTFDFADVPAAYAELRDGHVRGKLAVAI